MSEPHTRCLSRPASAVFSNTATICRPQENAQANMTPQDAKEMWIKYLEPLRKSYGVRLGSPPTSSAPSGKTWTQGFLSQFGSECNVDFIALRYSVYQLISSQSL